jgi:hypothetical protein
MGQFGCPGGPSRRGLAGSRDGTSEAGFAGRGVLHVLIHEVIHSGRVDPSSPAMHPEARRVSQPPAVLGIELETLERVLREQQASIEIHPIRP